VTVAPEGDEDAPTAVFFHNQATTADDGTKEQKDSPVKLELTYPVGKSPKVFTSGWVFGAKCVVSGEDDKEIDLSEKVQWSGSGTFNPASGSRCRPAFKAAGANTIKLTVEVEGKPITKSFSVVAVSPADYACVGGTARCLSDAHACPACPHDVKGPIQTGSSLVMIGGKAAVRVGDTGVHAACCGPNTFEIAGGDSEVMIDGKPAAKVGSQTKHCGGMGTIISSGH